MIPGFGSHFQFRHASIRPPGAQISTRITAKFVPARFCRRFIRVFCSATGIRAVFRAHPVAESASTELIVLCSCVSLRDTWVSGRMRLTVAQAASAGSLWMSGELQAGSLRYGYENTCRLSCRNPESTQSGAERAAGGRPKYCRCFMGWITFVFVARAGYSQPVDSSSRHPFAETFLSQIFCYSPSHLRRMAMTFS